MATKYTPEQNMKIIAEVAKKHGISACFMIAKAKIESTLNNLAKNGSYWGLFQCSADVAKMAGFTHAEMLDPRKATEAAIKYIEYNKKQFDRRFPGQFENWMAYQMHQQGAGGFMTIFGSPTTAIASSPRAKAIRNNMKKAWTDVKTHADFVKKWRETFAKLESECNLEYACLVEGTNLGDSGFCPLEVKKDADVPNPLRTAARNRSIAIGAGIAALLGVVLYKYS